MSAAPERRAACSVSYSFAAHAACSPLPHHHPPQALLALREVVLGRWAVVGAQARQATLQFLLHTSLVQLAADPRPLLRTQVGGGWLIGWPDGWLAGRPSLAAARSAEQSAGLYHA